jgi:hypothetical protein
MERTAGEISAGGKQAALEAVLKSQAFGRSDQLRSLLGFLVGQEAAGRRESLTEYQIGVEGLGLSANYAPGEDSTVRNRMYMLRRKLEEAYRTELAGTPIRIEFSKGSYLPHFVEVEAKAPPAAAPVEESAEVVLDPRSLPRARRSWGPWVGFLAGLAVAGLAFLLSAQRSNAGVDEVLREAWGPLLTPEADTLVCVATTPQMPVRGIPGVWKPMAGEPVLEAPPSVVDWYLKLRPSAAGSRIYLLPTTNSVGLGDALGAAAASRLLTSAGARFQVLAERLVPLPAMRKRNVVLLGGSSDSDTIQQLLRTMPFRVEFNAESGDYAIEERKAGGRIFRARRSQGNHLEETFGLVTVMPSLGSDGAQRTIVFVGVYTAGVQGAMDFLTSPEAMRGLRERMGGRFAASYQLVVRTTTDKMLPLSYRYETHVTVAP